MQGNTEAVARRSPRQQRSRAKVEAILGAVEALAADDVGSLTTSTIAKRAGISVGSLYQYFENREDIVERLLERYRRELDEMMHKTFANDGVTSLAEGLAAVTGRYVEFIRTRPAFRVLWYSTDFPNPHRIVSDVGDHALAGLFADAAYQYGLIVENNDDMVHALFASWLALDAIIDAAFRFDADADDRMLAQAGRIATAIELPIAA